MFASCTHLWPQITVSTHAFVYDHVFGGGGGLPPACLYNTCVLPLVHGLFKGYNATVLAYGAREISSAQQLAAANKKSFHRDPLVVMYYERKWKDFWCTEAI